MYACVRVLGLRGRKIWGRTLLCVREVAPEARAGRETREEEDQLKWKLRNLRKRFLREEASLKPTVLLHTRRSLLPFSLHFLCITSNLPKPD